MIGDRDCAIDVQAIEIRVGGNGSDLHIDGRIRLLELVDRFYHAGCEFARNADSHLAGELVVYSGRSPLQIGDQRCDAFRRLKRTAARFGDPQHVMFPPEQAHAEAMLQSLHSAAHSRRVDVQFDAGPAQRASAREYREGMEVFPAHARRFGERFNVLRRAIADAVLLVRDRRWGPGIGRRVRGQRSTVSGSGSTHGHLSSANRMTFGPYHPWREELTFFASQFVPLGLITPEIHVLVVTSADRRGIERACHCQNNTTTAANAPNNTAASNSE
ncbi:MAG: hypothetical protein OXL38_21000 [Gammaproteobacteria bacterium]|nr:hypothetical protein [Gammaproteobacteria bacterium]